MKQLITITGASGSTNQSVYTPAQLSKMARQLVGPRGKPFAYTVNFDERTGRTRLLVSYETAPNEQTFATMAI